MAKPTKTQVSQDGQIRAGTGVRYIAESLGTDGTVEFFTERVAADKPNGVGAQQMLAALRKTDGDGNPVFAIVAAEVSDGRGGMRLVTGRDIPDIRDNAVGVNIKPTKKDEEWMEIRAAALRDRESRADVGRAQTKVAVENLSTEVVAQAEKAGTPAPPPAIEHAGKAAKAKAATEG